ncbi:methyltryptophan oxidase [Williamsia sp. Leaf354]|uniref:N-methyl-L-tryptophan oxidase n=1 Tax=Williamsia sp. Leaf354 TaxID=1736349 RepID=UPI0006FE2556|nr:N-methyl-L-tryptophan oxidase [Williamsia sp. Leaf354]KQR98805.1 methyltryptophan oxidase [Williamsia sp. Leaf354]
MTDAPLDPGDVDAQVIVIGLGGMGSAAAYHLARRGVSVLGLEQFTPAHDRGSSHGGSRIIRQSYFEDPAYVPLLLRAYELWEELARASGREVYRITGGLFIGPPDCATVSGSLHAAQLWGLEHEVLDAGEVARRFPGFVPEAGQVAVYEPLAGFARPEETVAAHIELAGREGADLRFGETVRSWSDHGQYVEVVTDSGRLRARELVICPGAWAPEILADLGVSIEIERQVMYWFGLDAPTAADDPSADDVPAMVDAPIYIQENADIEQIYGFPAIDGPDGGVKVAFFRRGDTCSPETIDRVVHDDETERMRTRVRQLLPGVAGPALDAATCMYSTTPDHNFVIARHPRHDRVTVACGFSGHGFKFVPVVGEILADLVVDGHTDHPIDIFDPTRTALAAGGGDRVATAGAR